MKHASNIPIADLTTDHGPQQHPPAPSTNIEPAQSIQNTQSTQSIQSTKAIDQSSIINILTISSTSSCSTSEDEETIGIIKRNKHRNQRKRITNNDQEHHQQRIAIKRTYNVTCIDGENAKRFSDDDDDDALPSSNLDDETTSTDDQPDDEEQSDHCFNTTHSKFSSSSSIDDDDDTDDPDNTIINTKTKRFSHVFVVNNSDSSTSDSSSNSSSTDDSDNDTDTELDCLGILNNVISDNQSSLFVISTSPDNGNNCVLKEFRVLSDADVDNLSLIKNDNDICDNVNDLQLVPTDDTGNNRGKLEESNEMNGEIDIIMGKSYQFLSSMY